MLCFPRLNHPHYRLCIKSIIYLAQGILGAVSFGIFEKVSLISIKESLQALVISYFYRAFCCHIYKVIKSKFSTFSKHVNIYEIKADKIKILSYACFKLVYAENHFCHLEKNTT